MKGTWEVVETRCSQILRIRLNFQTCELNMMFGSKPPPNAFYFALSQIIQTSGGRPHSPSTSAQDLEQNSLNVAWFCSHLSNGNI